MRLPHDLFEVTLAALRDPWGVAQWIWTIAKTFNATGEYQSPNLGKTLAIDMVPNGDGTYSGSVWRPSNNKVYIGKMTLRGDKLKLKGCVAGGLICSAQNWVRLN